jgi:hypothetical protein
VKTQDAPITDPINGLDLANTAITAVDGDAPMVSDILSFTFLFFETIDTAAQAKGRLSW